MAARDRANTLMPHRVRSFITPGGETSIEYLLAVVMIHYDHYLYKVKDFQQTEKILH